MLNYTRFLIARCQRNKNICVPFFLIKKIFGFEKKTIMDCFKTIIPNTKEKYVN